MPKKVQFAFQGGGARLALLLPVVQAILACEEEGTIQVTRVAGTSAGAIAAALVAGRADMKALVDHLRAMARNQPDQMRVLFPNIGDGFLAKCSIFLRVFILKKPDRHKFMITGSYDVTLLIERCCTMNGSVTKQGSAFPA
jgi:predicted acylesterase/phospholipase RssA